MISFQFQDMVVATACTWPWQAEDKGHTFAWPARGEGCALNVSSAGYRSRQRRRLLLRSHSPSRTVIFRDCHCQLRFLRALWLAGSWHKRQFQCIYSLWGHRSLRWWTIMSPQRVSCWNYCSINRISLALTHTHYESICQIPLWKNYWICNAYPAKVISIDAASLLRICHAWQSLGASATFPTSELQYSTFFL